MALRGTIPCFVALTLSCVSSGAPDSSRASVVPPAPKPAAASPTMAPVVQEGPLVDALAAPLVRQIAEAHEWLGRSDALFWAPWDCLAPPPAPTFLSRAEGGEHARKVYHLFVQDPGQYALTTRSPLPDHPPVGTHAREPIFASAPVMDGGPRPWDVFRTTSQVLVKESWVPRACKDDETREVAVAGAKRYCAGERGPLFVMAKPRAPVSATDDGWVYGAYVEGEVTAAGRVATCMGCHVRAPHGRLFGLPKTN